MYFWRILLVIAKYRLHTLISFAWYALPLRVILNLIGFFTGKSINASRGERITLSLEELGVIFIKFGQILSTRRDLLPEDIGTALSRLQDNCKPFSNMEARRIIETELGDYIDNIFDNFSANFLSAASIAQVYTASLKTGEEVVVKVVRPHIEKQIKRDLKVLYRLAHIANLHSTLKRLRPTELVKEFEFIILNELNMNFECSNARILRKNFKDSNLLYVPKVYSEYTSKSVLTQERIYGIPISDIDAIKEQNIDLKILAENGVKIFFTQVFKHNFFHADMHAGNIFVDKNGKYNGVDFGIMGSLTKEDRMIVALLLQAFFNEQYEKITELFIDSGWIKKSTNKIALTHAFRLVCEPMFAKDLSQISFGEVLLNLFSEARKFDAYIQPQLLLLDKTLLAIEGLGRNIYPYLDLWQTAKPLLDDIIKEEFNISKKIKNRDNTSELLYQLSTFPRSIINIERELKQQHIAKEALISIQKRNNKLIKIFGVLVLIALIIL